MEPRRLTEEEVSNLHKRRLLQESDWKVIRHRDQLAAGIVTSLTEQEYNDLLVERQTLRDSIVEEV